MRDLGSGPAANRAKEWAHDPEKFDAERMLKDIDPIGKGRFAQRWSYHIAQQAKPTLSCPASIKAALKHVTDQIT